MEQTTFIYLWKSLVVRHGFRLNIQYLFIYLFKGMSTKAGRTDDLYLLIEITSCDTWFSFEYSLSIYLFIQSDVNKSKWNRRPLLHVSLILSTISGRHQNTYGWQAGGRHTT